MKVSAARSTRTVILLLLSFASVPFSHGQVTSVLSSTPLKSSNTDPKETILFLKKGQRVELLDESEGYVLVRVDSTTAGWMFMSQIAFTDEAIAWFEERGSDERIDAIIESQLDRGQYSYDQSLQDKLFSRMRNGPGLLFWVENEDNESITITYSIDTDTRQTTGFGKLWWRRLGYVDEGEFVQLMAQKGDGKGGIHTEIIYNGKQIGYESALGQFKIAHAKGTTR